MTLVDEKGQLYPGGVLALQSSGVSAPNTSLKPGQGLGQAELKDPLLWGFKIPAKVRIVNIIKTYQETPAFRRGRNGILSAEGSSCPFSF